MKESTFQKKVLKYLREEVGGYWIKIHASSYQGTGEPDIVGCYKGKFYAFELKRPDGKGKATELQKYKIKQINEAGGTGRIVDSLDQIIEVFEEEGLKDYVDIQELR